MRSKTKEKKIKIYFSKKKSTLALGEQNVESWANFKKCNAPEKSGPEKVLEKVTLFQQKNQTNALNDRATEL
jgi:hypothetical protein